MARSQVWLYGLKNGWTLDLDDVCAALRPNTRLVAVNFPNNPTGAVASRETFDGLVALCAERGIHLFNDEVYRGLERVSARQLPQAAEVYDRGVSLNVMSKAYGLRATDRPDKVGQAPSAAKAPFEVVGPRSTTRSRLCECVN